MRRYYDKLALPGVLRLEDLESIVEKIREIGAAVPCGLRQLEFTVTADDDWDLHGLLRDLQNELASYGLDLEIDKSKVGDAI